ncbi:hypothetical protein HLB44_12135 [Aquincola sp. S2]|uniref:Uncharacterized protein n=1 Tax=Pseudaquabacterium terrae TaxID=2732868 RepID=A0ABX2EGM2_9BURK|nr:hypothetical protein [Aquabacterium terrae]NRF67736.1 hypothetical protein [Aquabacterium terrae]
MWAADETEAQVMRRIVARLAIVAVQGEQLQMMCDELEPLLRLLRQEPRLQPTAALLEATVETVSGVARDIAVVTETLGSGLQPTRPPRRPVSGGDAS